MSCGGVVSEGTRGGGSRVSQELLSADPGGSREGHFGHAPGCCAAAASVLLVLTWCAALPSPAAGRGCLVEAVATSLPTPGPLGSATGRD